MRALTVRNPWAHHIATGEKTIEVRTWRTDYRGPLLITAGAKPYPGMPYGCTVCLVDLVAIRDLTSNDRRAAMLDENWEIYGDEYAWVLDNPRRLPARPVKGRLMLWHPEQELLAILGL